MVKTPLKIYPLGAPHASRYVGVGFEKNLRVSGSVYAEKHGIQLDNIPYFPQSRDTMQNIAIEGVEEFRPVRGFESRYLIGSRGTVRSTVFGRAKDRRVVVGKDGYVRVNLADSEGPVVTRYVHRLVAEAFIPNPEGHTDVNHKDMDKQNNCVSNLEWVSHRDNLLKARAIKGNWCSLAQIRKASKPIVAQDVVSGAEWEFASARAWAVSKGNPNMAANVSTAIRTGRPAYGYYWRHKTPEEVVATNTDPMPVYRDPRMLMVARKETEWTTQGIPPLSIPGVKLGSDLEARG